jgi:hypothetical protein
MKLREGKGTSSLNTIWMSNGRESEAFPPNLNALFALNGRHHLMGRVVFQLILIAPFG